MQYTREQQKRFLDLELEAISESYIKKLKRDALALLADNQIYVTQFVKIDVSEAPIDNDADAKPTSGEIILKFKSEKGIPRKNDYFTAVVLDKSVDLPPKWKGLSWGDLRRHQLEFSEVHCVWHGRTDERGFILCGFQGLSIEMAEFLRDKVGCAIILGPQEPPMDYYQNLISLVNRQDAETDFDRILDYDRKDNQWRPRDLHSDDDKISILRSTLSSSDEVIIQGPPGTGKTSLMASMVSELLDEQKSVLVTALTNRALMELAEKDAIKKHLDAGKVCKTSVSTDEMSRLPRLVPIECKQATCSKGILTLSTFYNSSRWGSNADSGVAMYDYVIMDEASQALFSMIACCKKLGQKVIWIGDQKQLPPIVSIEDRLIIRNDFGDLANGFETLCRNFDYPSFILADTYRLTQRAADFTSIFYSVPLKSLSKPLEGKYFSKYLQADGGPMIVYHNMPRGQKEDIQTADFVAEIIADILSAAPKMQVAVLSKFIKTVKMLQDRIITKVGGRPNILIDTVERIQGMTRDVVIYVIPNTLTSMSLDNALFNVATSRATRNTIIVADRSIHNENMSEEIRRYLLSMESGKMAELDSGSSESKIVIAGNLSVTVLGKINLPEKRFKEIVDGKENIFIIDTNVFVNCPTIISRIGKYKVVIPTTVLEELDHLKLKQGIDKKALNDAAKNINDAFQKKFSHMEEGDASLLPAGFDSKKADCLILSVALKYKKDNVNPILLTSDNMLQSKALGLGITTISLRDFLSERRS